MLGWSAILVATALTLPAQAEAAPRRLTATEIRAVLPGSYVQEVVPAHLQDLSTPEQFNSDGTYVRQADNRDIEGRYAIEQDMVCVDPVIHKKTCRFMLVDRYGQHFFQSATLPTARLVPVKLIPQR